VKFNLLPSLGTCRWHYLEVKSHGTIIPFAATASPLESQQLARELHAFERTATGERLHNMPMTKEIKRVIARDFFFQNRISNTDLVRILWGWSKRERAKVTGKDIYTFFGVSEDAASAQPNMEPLDRVGFNLFVNHLVEVLDCYLPSPTHGRGSRAGTKKSKGGRNRASTAQIGRYGSKDYARKTEELLKLLKVV
jgi:hypothetical protein